MCKTTFAFALFTLTLLFAATSCGKDNDKVDYAALADCSAIVAADNTYTNSIKAILDASCATAGCHNAVTASAGVDLTTYAKAKTAFENKEALCSIHHGSGCKPMPNVGAQLSNALINQIDCWAKNGYAE